MDNNNIDMDSFSGNIHQDGLAIIWDDLAESEWKNQLNDLKASFEKLKYDVVCLNGSEIEELISLSKMENKFQKYKCLICTIFGYKTKDQIQSIVDAFDQCSTLKGKPKLFFAQQQKKKDDVEKTIDGIRISVNVNVMQFDFNEGLEYLYRHDLSSFFIQGVCKILNTIDIDIAESWLSFNDFIDIISKKMTNTSKVELHKNELGLLSDYDRNIGIDWHVLGVQHAESGNYYEALSFYLRALGYFRHFSEEMDASENAALCLRDIGTVYMAKKNYEQASVHYKESLAIYNRIYQQDEGYVNKSFILHNLGTMAVPTADFESGIFFLKQAVEMRRQLFKNEDNLDLAQSINSLGMCYLQKKETSTALVYFIAAYDMRKRLFDLKKISIDEGLAHSLTNIGAAYMAIGDLKKAKTYTNKALKMRSQLFKDNDNEWLAASLHNFGLVFLSKGKDLDKAELYLKRGFEMRMRLFTGNKNHPDVIESMKNCQLLDNLKQKKNLRNANKKKCQIL